MIKKYVIVVSAILVVVMFSSTSSASFLYSRQGIFEKVRQNSVFGKVFEKLSQIASPDEDSISINAVEDDEYDDIADQEDPEEDILLPKIWNVVGEITPDDGDDPVVEENDLGESPTIDIDGEEGAYLNDEPTVEINGIHGRSLERVIEIITEYNEKVESILQKVAERTFAPGTMESNGVAENIVETVVVVGDSGGTAESNIVDHVIVGDPGGTAESDIVDHVVVTDNDK